MGNRISLSRFLSFLGKNQGSPTPSPKIGILPTESKFNNVWVTLKKPDRILCRNREVKTFETMERNQLDDYLPSFL